MAISKESIMLASDITTVLSNKQDKLNFTPIKSINGTSADSTGNININTISTMPNYSAKIDLGTTNNYTAPSNGMWYGTFTQTQANWANLYVNGVLVDGFGSWTTGYPTLHAFVCKGDFITWETGHSCQGTAFFPFK